MSSYWGIVTEHEADLTSCRLRSSRLRILAVETVPSAVQEQGIGVIATLQPSRRTSYGSRRLDLVIRGSTVFTLERHDDHLFEIRDRRQQ